MKPRILIVEDETIVALDMTDRLLALGYHPVGNARNAARALELAQEQQPDLVLSDIRLEGQMDGIALAQELRRRFDLPVIFLTAYSEAETLERAKQAEPYGFILKPFHDQELRAIIELALFRHQTEAEFKRVERARAASLQRQTLVNQLQQKLLGSGDLVQKLKMISNAVVDIFAADFCRIWVIGPGDLCDRGCPHANVTEGPHVCRQRDCCLHLLVSSGRYTHTDGTHRRVPFGAYKIGRVASGEDHSFMTNDVTHDPRVHNHDWARGLGLAAFAGYQLRVPDGEILGVLALFKASAITQEEDVQLDALSGTAAQVIQAFRTEEAFLKSEERHRALVETSFDWIWEIDTQARFTYSSPRAKDILGYSQEEFLSRTPFEFMPAAEAKRVGEIFARIAADRQPFQAIESVNLHQDGHQVVISSSGVPIFGPEGEFCGYRGSCRDITARRVAEEEIKARQAALEASESRLREAQRIGHIGSWEYLIDSDTLIWSEEVYRIFEIDSILAPFHYEEFLEMVHPEDRTLVNAAYTAALEQKNPYNLKHRLLLPDGRIKWVHERAETSYDFTGNPKRSMGTVQDITESRLVEEERKRLQDELSQSQKMEAIGTLAGGIAHDFNNILWAILGYAEMASISLGTPREAREYLEEVLQAGHRASELVGQILAFSRKLESDKTSLSLKPIIAETLKLLRAGLPATIEFYQFFQSHKMALVDATQVRQIIMNLAANAFQAMEKTGGRLDIILEDVTLDKSLPAIQGEIQPGAYVKLTIRDTGPGIPAELAQRIFEPYFTTKEMGKGTGLGLATVLGLVKSNGGEIILDTLPGEGTSFIIYFPAAAASRITLGGPAETCLAKGSGRVLFVDDEPALAKLGQDFLSHLGYEATTFTSSLEALETFRSRPEDFDLVVTDFTMPKLTGVGLARRIKEIRPEMPIIVCTGYGENFNREEIDRLGLKAVLSKPLRFQQMGEVIQRVLGCERDTDADTIGRVYH